VEGSNSVTAKLLHMSERLAVRCARNELWQGGPQSNLIWYDIYLTAIGYPPGGTVQYTYTYKQYRERHKTSNNTKIRKSAGRAPSLRVLPWHLPYNWGKSKEKP